MNLEGFTVNTSDDEYKRVVCHETGHTLSFPHEHMRKELIVRIHRQKAYDYFCGMYCWDCAMVDAQVLTRFGRRHHHPNPARSDVDHVLSVAGANHQGWKTDSGGKNINTWDFAFAGKIIRKNAQQAAAAMDEDDLGFMISNSNT